MTECDVIIQNDISPNEIRRRRNVVVELIRVFPVHYQDESLSFCNNMHISCHIERGILLLFHGASK